MEYLKKKVVRGKNRSEDIYFSCTSSDKLKIWRLKIGGETPLKEEEFMAYLKLYLDEWIKSQRLLEIDDLNIVTRVSN